MYDRKDWRPASTFVWQYLTSQIPLRPFLFFREVAIDVGISQRHLNAPLSYIMEFCERASLPPLTGIILTKHEFERKNRHTPSAHFRLKHQGKFYFPGDTQFEVLYHQRIKEIQAVNWQAIAFEPAPMHYARLKKQLLEDKKQYETDKHENMSLALLARCAR